MSLHISPPATSEVGTPTTLQEVPPIDAPPHVEGGVSDAEGGVEFRSANTSSNEGKRSHSQELAPPEPSYLNTLKESIKTFDELGSRETTASIYQFMAVLQEIAQLMRNVAREGRWHEFQAQQKSMEDSVEKMKSQAAMQLVSAVVQGIGQIGGGIAQTVVTVAGAAKSASAIKPGQESEQSKQIADTIRKQGASEDAVLEYIKLSRTTSETAQTLNIQGQKYTYLGQAAGQIGSGLGQTAGAGFSYQAGLDEAAKQEDQINASKHEHMSGEEGEVFNQSGEILRDVRDKLAAIEQANQQAAHTMINNI